MCFHLLGFKEEVVEGICIDVNGRGAGGHEARPLPPIILGIEQKICADNRYTDSHHSQNGEDEQHEAVDIVDLVRPERGEDKVPATRKN